MAALITGTETDAANTLVSPGYDKLKLISETRQNVISFSFLPPISVIIRKAQEQPDRKASPESFDDTVLVP